MLLDYVFGAVVQFALTVLNERLGKLIIKLKYFVPVGTGHYVSIIAMPSTST